MYAFGCPYTHATGSYGLAGLITLGDLGVSARRGSRLQARRKLLVVKLKHAKNAGQKRRYQRRIDRIDKHIAAMKGRLGKKDARRSGKGKDLTRRQTRAAEILGYKTKAQQAAAKKKAAAEEKDEGGLAVRGNKKTSKKFQAIQRAHRKMVQLRLAGQSFTTSVTTASAEAGKYKKDAVNWLMAHRSFYAALPLPQVQTAWQASLSISSPGQLTEVVNRSPEVPLPEAPRLQSSASPVIQQAMQQAAQQAYYPQPSFRPGPGGSAMQAAADADDEDDKDLDAEDAEDEGDDAADAAGAGDDVVPWYKNPMYLGLGALGLLAAYGLSRKGTGKTGKGKHGKDDMFAAAAG